MQATDKKLESILDIEELKKLFGYFSVSTGLDVSLYDQKGESVFAVGGGDCICGYLMGNSHCAESIVYGGSKSASLGEPYIFRCACGLIMCCSPVMYNELQIGSIACGPVMLWDADKYAHDELAANIRSMGYAQQIEPADKFFAHIKTLECINVTSVAQVLHIIVNSLSREHSKYLLCQEKISEQQTTIDNLLKNQKSNRHLSKAVSFIDANYKEDISLKTVAAAVFVSEYYLSHLFRDKMNITFSDYLCSVRIEKAKELLENSDKRIQEVSDMSGFKDSNYFAKTFKRLTDMTPTQYRSGNSK